MKEYKSWTQLKALVSSKTLGFQYQEFTFYYSIWTDEANITYYTELWKDTSKIKGIDVTQNDLDIIDWENNFKEDANGVYSGPDINVNVTGGIVAIEGDISASILRYSPRFYLSKDSIVLSQSVDTVLADLDYDGQVDSILLNFDRDDIEFIISVDSTEILRVSLEDLKSSLVYDVDISATKTNSFPIQVSNNGKDIRINFVEPVGVINNLTIKAKKTISGDTNMSAIMVVYREKIT